MTTAIRHGAILDIVGGRPVSSQQQLVRALDRRGFQVSQATVSRDVRRLGLVKVPLSGGGFRYAPADQAAGPVRPDVERAMRQFVTGVVEGDALLVLKTRSGNANALAVVIDQADWPEVAGTIAGDDTVLLVLKSVAARDRIRKSLAALLEGE